MRAYMVRSTKEAQERAGHGSVALVVASSLEALFWSIDQYSDPSDYEYCTANSNFAIMLDYTTDGDEEEQYVEYSADNRFAVLTEQMVDKLFFDEKARWKPMPSFSDVRKGRP